MLAGEGGGVQGGGSMRRLQHRRQLLARRWPPLLLSRSRPTSLALCPLFTPPAPPWDPSASGQVLSWRAWWGSSSPDCSY